MALIQKMSFFVLFLIETQSRTYRCQPGEGDADLEGVGDVDEVLVLRVELVDPSVLVSAILTVPLSGELVVVIVKSVVKINVAKQGPTVHVDGANGASCKGKM